MKVDYRKICQPLFEALSDRTKEIISRRFGLSLQAAKAGVGSPGEKETLEKIGQDLGLTRERVRQIEEDGLKRIKRSPYFSNLEDIFRDFKNYFKAEGGLKKESILFQAFGESADSSNWVNFLLALGGDFQRIVADKELHAFWTQNQKIAAEAKKFIGLAKDILDKNRKILPFRELLLKAGKDAKLLKSSLEISKDIVQVSDDCFGLKTWPEVNPRGVKDLAYLVFKNVKKPLHFAEVANSIDNLFANPEPRFQIMQASANFTKKKTHPQTVHNELIKDSRFVLVGRGTYALAEWGYKPGVVKEVIMDTLKAAQKPLTKREIVDSVLSQRLVKENTILLNLNDKNHFLKTEDGKYTVREA